MLEKAIVNQLFSNIIESNCSIRETNLAVGTIDWTFAIALYVAPPKKVGNNSSIKDLI
jgi:hypothetical protein